MIQTKLHPYVLNFIQPGGTSRGVMTHKKSWIIELTDEETNKKGWGECSIIENLSPDYQNDLAYEKNIQLFLSEISADSINKDLLSLFPSIQFGIETALKSLVSPTPFLLYENDFSLGKEGITINGLIWMGKIDFMKSQIETKLASGSQCLKLKIGAKNLDDELSLLKSIRKTYSSEQLEIRVDANGAFYYDNALAILEKLSKFEIHSIEQPIHAGNWKQMASLCSETPLPIALDEELIGITEKKMKSELLQEIKPHYIILKPSLVGGFTGTSEWIELAKNQNIPWWVTSALESNIGLNAIAQYTASHNTTIPQGLGTGSLYDNNITSPLKVIGDKLHYQVTNNWDLSLFIF